MSTVGLVVVTYKDNFGSALQSYATQEAVKRLGFETEILRIASVDKTIFSRKILFYLQRLVVRDERKYIIGKVLSKLKHGQTDGDYAGNMRTRHAMYETFNKQYFRMADKQPSWKALAKRCESYAAVLVGSDQLWRPSNIAGGYFTLEFVPDQILKIACSTSFGVSVLPRSQRKRAEAFLNRIEHISVRENTGQALVKELTGRDVPVICDPTMFLTATEWQQVVPAAPAAQGDYILCYFMGDNPEHRAFVKRLQKHTGYKIVALLHGSVYIPADEAFADEAPYAVGPGEFISLIQNAKFMCTDSFHGTVFSILNRTSFFTFRRFADTSAFSTNDRLHTLLEWTGLSGRLLQGTEDVAACAAETIDYDAVTEKVDAKRQEALEYLRGALS